MVVMVILQQTWVARLDAGDRVGGAKSAEVWTVWGGDLVSLSVGFSVSTQQITVNGGKGCVM